MIRQAALVLIDLQECMCDPSRPPRNNPEAETNIGLLLEAWREAEWPVIHVHHASHDPNSGFWPGQPGARVQDAFAPLQTEFIVEKSMTDAFSGTTLEQHLQDILIEQITLVGVATNYSVEATARAASSLGFETVVVSDGCFTFARPDILGVLRSAQEIHVASLSNLTGEYSQIRCTNDVLKSMKG